MRIIAITGGIGSGKTTVARWIGETGVPVLDADQISRELTRAGGAALPALRNAFGDAVFEPDGTLNRGKLANKVFAGDVAARQKLNAILHPMVNERMQKELARYKAQGVPVAVVEVPLLYEAGMEDMADAVICVTASEDVRLERLKQRSGLTHQQARDRMLAQQDVKQTETLADYVISTDGPIEENKQTTLKLWKQIAGKDEA